MYHVDTIKVVKQPTTRPASRTRCDRKLDHHSPKRFKIQHRHRTSFGVRAPDSASQNPIPMPRSGLPIGCENLDTLSSRDLLKKFYNALELWREPLEQFLEQQKPLPSCMISDKCLFWTSETAQRFNVPRIVFHGMGCFSLLSSHNVKLHKAHISVASDSEHFQVPGLPYKVEVTRAKFPGSFVSLPDIDDTRNKMQEAEMSAYGVVVNSFSELEHGCVNEYRKAIQKKVWAIGPVSLCNRMNLDKFERGNKASINEQKCLKCLDSMEQRSVIYACLGSLYRLGSSQLIELGLGLEASQQPFIWVVKTGNQRANDELENWFSKHNFEERIKGRGLLIKGWAPQVLILSHPAIKGFLTHCGWNSTLEAVCSGVPMITWPQFSEQFFNEKLIVEILKIGVGVGVEVPFRWGEEGKLGVLVKKEEIKKSIDMLMNRGEEGEERRMRARELAEMARRAVGEGGSSNLDMSFLVQDILEHLNQQERG
ncbi:UDP-glycosyltransferase 73D1 [Hibiscus syriacus]|uniref:Glycosyltransferase n=1 Tax=Hibiscus syriacus TaxID=106335 RepID=A0A6A2YET4_HIBSY|nr:UDP-glycosyltransferase 73D1 [Hibiscus syriacus]